MSNDLAKFFENLLEENLIQYFTVTNEYDTKDYVLIKLYYPQIITKICKLLDKEFGIINRDELIISREEDGYHATQFVISLNGQEVAIKMKSMLKDTWGVS